MKFVLLVFISALVAACSPNKLEQTAMSPEERGLVRNALQDVALNNPGKLAQKIPPELVPKLSKAMPAMRAALPEPPFELSLTNANWTMTGSVHRVHAIYQLKGRNGWALVDTTLASSGGRTLLTGLYIQKTPGDPAKLNGFTLSNAGVGGWAMLGAMAAALSVTIAALVKIWRSGMFRRRWLWTIGSLIGISIFRLNWTTGEWGFQLLHVQLFSVGAFKQPIYAPWILNVSIPVVALIALFKSGCDEWEEPGLFTEEPPAAES